MTAAELAAPTAVTSRATRHRFAGTGALIRLNLRRERLPLLVWVLGIGAWGAAIFPSIAALYPQESERAALVASISTNPSFLVITGPIDGTSVGAVSAWRIAAAGTTLVALMAVFTVIRRTRADEEAGRTELLSSAVVGRAAPLAAAVAVAGGASLAIGVLMGAAAFANTGELAGSLAFAGGMAGCGLVFAGVAAIAAQVAESARTAVGIACAAVATTYALRAIGDVQSSASWLTWLSPQGWAGHVAPFAGNHFAVLLLFLAATVGGIAVAVWLLDRRDLGLALFPARLGPATNPRMSSAGALARRLQRGTLVGWLVGMVALGAVAGGVASTSSDLVTSNPTVEQAMEKIGGAGAIADILLATMGALAGLFVGGYAISSALRMRTEETADRVGPVLATPVSRPGWVAGHLAFVVVGPALLLGTAGVVTGLVNMAQAGDLSVGFGAAVGSMLVQIPATLVLGGLAVALFGWLPRLTSVAWAALVVALLLGQLGQLLQVPQWLMDVSPYTHIPQVPTADMRWTPVVVLTILAVALMAFGVVGFRRRDVS